MDYEKAYKEALNRARKLKESPQEVFYEFTPKEGDTISDYIFPELKESEDERIRKELIDFVKSRLAGFPQCDRFIAWLEKQKPKKTAIEAWKEMRIEVLAQTFGNKRPPESDEGSKVFSINDIDEIFEKITDAEVKQMPIEYVNGEDYGIDGLWHAHRIPEKTLGKVDGSQSDDGILEHKAAIGATKEIIAQESTIENTDTTKFKVGDWIIHQGTDNVYQVRAIIDNQYQLKYGDNYTVQKCTYVDRNTRLWTIQDVKDGDILVCDDNIIAIYREPASSVFFRSYCYFMDRFFPLVGCHTIKFYHPATKEQCDILFDKMKEAGYKWDADNKELKRI